MTDAETAIQVLRSFSEFHGVSHVMIFECYRRMKDGSDKKVTVKIHDSGPDVEHGRYTAEAWSEDGKGCSGNSEDSIRVALAVVHWGNLDK